MTERPAFEKISSHEEFQKYYWYQAELAAICKSLGIDHTGVKTELKFILLSLCRRIWGVLEKFASSVSIQGGFT
mgnify:CR=1 FL=1